MHITRLENNYVIRMPVFVCPYLYAIIITDVFFNLCILQVMLIAILCRSCCRIIEHSKWKILHGP